MGCAVALALTVGCDSEPVKPDKPAGPAPTAQTKGDKPKPTAKPADKPSPAGATATPTAAAAQPGESLEGLVITEGWTKTDDRFIKILGEIKNDSKNWIISPGIEVDFFDKDGKPLTVTSVVTETRKDLGKTPRDGQPADRMVLPPGEVAVFSYTRDVKKLSGKYGSHKLHAKGRVLEGTPPKVAIEAKSTRKEDQGTYFITGKIANKGTVDCRSPGVVVGFYTADGKVRLTTTKTPDALFQKMLAPGKSIDFEVKKHTFDAAADIASVKVWADCHPRR